MYARLVLVLLGAVACHNARSPASTAVAEGGPGSGGNASVAGKVLDAVSHDALQSAAVSLTPIEPNRASLTASSAATNRDGEFEIDNLVAGRYELRVSRSGYTNYRTNVSVGIRGSQRFSVTLAKSVTPCAPPNPGRKPADCP